MISFESKSASFTSPYIPVLSCEAFIYLRETSILVRSEACVLSFRAAKHNCTALRQAAIPLAATNFDRIDPAQMMLLTAGDMKELLASDQLSSTEVGSETVKEAFRRFCRKVFGIPTWYSHLACFLQYMKGMNTGLVHSQKSQVSTRQLLQR